MAVSNKTWRVHFKAGWVGIFSGESQGKAVERILPVINGEGYRVVFVVPDKFSFGKKIAVLLIAVLTLGFVVISENLLIIGEQVS